MCWYNRFDPIRKRQVLVGGGVVLAIILLIIIIVLAVTLSPKSESDTSPVFIGNGSFHKNNTARCTTALAEAEQVQLSHVMLMENLGGGLGRGYNLFKANPRPTNQITNQMTRNGVEEPQLHVSVGYRKPVYDISQQYCGKTTPDGRFLVPQSVSVVEELECGFDFRIDRILDLLQYSDHLRKFVIIDDTNSSMTSLAFTASPDFRRMAEKTNTSHSFIVDAGLTCSVYEVGLIHEPKPEFTKEFQAAVEALPSDVTNDTFQKVLQSTFHQFFEDYGTHFADAVRMGAVHGYQYILQPKHWWRLTREPIESGATFDQVFEALNKFQISRNGLTDLAHLSELDRKLAMSYGANYEERLKYQIGVKPPSTLKASQWQAEVTGAPMPFEPKLKPLSSLLTAENFPKIKEIAKKRENLEKALDHYCSDILVPSESIPSCKPPKPRTEMPIYSGEKLTLRYARKDMMLGMPQVIYGIDDDSSFIQFANLAPTGLSHVIKLSGKHTKHRALKDGDLVIINATWCPLNDSKTFLTLSKRPAEDVKIDSEKYDTQLKNPIRVATYETGSLNAMNTAYLPEQSWTVKKRNTSQDTGEDIMPGDLVNFFTTIDSKTCWLQFFDATDTVKGDNSNKAKIPIQPFLVICGQSKEPQGWVIDSSYKRKS